MSDARRANAMSGTLTIKMVVTYQQEIDRRGKTRKKATSPTEGMV